LEITRMGETKNLRGQGAITHGAGEYGDCNCSVRSSLRGVIQIKILANWKLNMATNQCCGHSLGPAVRKDVKHVFPIRNSQQNYP